MKDAPPPTHTPRGPQKEAVKFTGGAHILSETGWDGKHARFAHTDLRFEAPILPLLRKDIRLGCKDPTYSELPSHSRGWRGPWFSGEKAEELCPVTWAAEVFGVPLSVRLQGGGARSNDRLGVCRHRNASPGMDDRRAA